MNENTEILVRELAEKLGITVDYLWAVLVKQAMISAVTDTLIFVVTGIALAAAGWGIVKALKSNDLDDLDDLEIFGELVVVALSLAWFVCLMCSVSSIAAGFFNPEYWALKQLLLL